MIESRRLSRSVAVVVAAALSLVSGALAHAQPSEVGESRVFAQVPPPGNPEETVVNGRIAYFGTTVGGDGVVAGDGLPSKIFGFDKVTGELEREITVEGENVNAVHGIAGMAMGARDQLFAASVSHGILRFDLRNDNAQSLYAPLPDLPICLPVGGDTPCSPTPEDRAPLGNGIAFDKDGYLYVTDSFQATIFRIPPGGGEAEAWFSDPRLHGAFGANGLKMSPDGKHVYFAVTGNLSGEGFIYRLPRVDQPAAADLETIHAFGDRQPDGIAFGKSGNLYVVLGTGGLAVLAPDGTLLEDFASEHFFNPSSLGFDDRGNVLITNHAFFELDTSRHTIVQMFVNDRGLPLVRPSIP